MRGVNAAVKPPCRMNVPSCTVRTRSSAGLYVTVNASIDTRDALLIDTGTVYGPPATRNSVPGAVTIICAAVGAALGAPVPAAPTGAPVTSRAGGVAGVV